MEHVPDALRDHILSFLPPRAGVRVASGVCWRWARACEELLQAHCTKHGWQPARSQRLRNTAGGSALLTELKWRALYL